MPCVAKFADDGVWYRGRVHHLEENSAEVTFVDYGNGDLIEISQLKELHPNFKEQHEYSFQCRLAGIPEDLTTKEEVLNKFEEYLESETLKVRVINVQNGRLVVQLLDGDDSVAVKLGLTEDLTIELADESIATTAQSLVENALISAMKDLELENNNSSSTEGGPPVGESDAEKVAGDLVSEMVESVCEEVSQLTIEGVDAETSPSPETSPPRVTISPADDSTVDGDFVDAETSPMKDTGDGEDDLSIENRQAVLSEEDSFQDALEESINPEEGEEDLSEKQKIGEEVGSGDREIENKHDEQIIGEEKAAEGAGLEHTVPAVEEKGVGVDDTIQENGKDVEIKEEVVSDTKEDGLEENLESNGEVIKTDDNEKQVDENQETVETSGRETE
ncbi:putative tudor domain-containing protein 15 isoform X1 [Apostichopus japonicus]|uniref:Putative tudor domain-containing protein 15 isoform X1 n=1 Tax=Stichopus japonicus TaxID=307972 RepID=A0A2G8JQ47_STIJA|nr:putative tudor domain-containing protein 15 isoform X1 [Apostichopus japonicus]